MSAAATGRRRLLAFMAVALTAFWMGCGGENSPTQTETPSISVSITPTSASVVQGASTDINVTVTGAGGFTGAATIALQTPPAGITGAVSGSQTTGGNTTATLTVSVGAGVSPGAYALTVRATGSGVTASQATFSLTVTAAPAYELSATPGQVIIEQGSDGTSTIGISRTNFTGAVTLSVEGAPAGVTSSFDTNPASGNTATLTVAVDASVAASTYTLTIRGTTSSLADRTVTLDLMVTAPSAPDYMLGVSPQALTINQGDSEDANVTVTRSNFTGAVTLAAEGVPADVTVSFSENPVSGTSSTMTVSVSASVTPGDYSFTLRGTATGLADKTLTFDFTVEQSSSYTITLDPAAITIDQAASGMVDVTLTRTNFAEAVDLSLENAPAGVSGSFSVDPATGDASVLTLDVGASTTPGDYSLTVRGTTASLSDETADLTLTVAQAQGFSLDPVTPISVEQGSSGVRAVTLTRSGGFAGDVTVTVTDLPAGITASVSPATTSGNSVDVTVNVSGSVSVGNYTGTVRANATGLPEDTEILDIAVTTASGQAVSLDFSVCTSDQRPIWLAYQDGSGPWTPVSGTNDTYSFNVSSATAGIAVALEPAVGATSVFVLYATQAEIVTGDLSELCDFEAVGKSVNGTVSGINQGLGEGSVVSLGDAWTQVSSDGGFSIVGVPGGTVDLVAYKWSFTGATDRVLLSRGLNPSNGANIGTIDFAGGSAFDPVTATITVQGGQGTGMGFLNVEYVTQPSAGACYYAPLDDFAYQSGSFTARGVPTGQQQAGDFHVVTVSDGFFTASEMFAQLQNRTISYGPALPTPTVTDVSGSAAFRRARIELTLPAEYNSLASFGLVDDTGDRSFFMLATADWLGGQSVTLETPDLSAVPGWDDAWVPTSSSTSDWLFSASSWTGTDCTENARSSSAMILGSVG